jgi:hypothetical protein
VRYQIPLCFVVDSSCVRLRFVVLRLCAVKEQPAAGNSKALVLLSFVAFKLLVDRAGGGGGGPREMKRYFRG